MVGGTLLRERQRQRRVLDHETTAGFTAVGLVARRVSTGSCALLLLCGAFPPQVFPQVAITQLSNSVAPRHQRRCSLGQESFR